MAGETQPLPPFPYHSSYTKAINSQVLATPAHVAALPFQAGRGSLLSGMPHQHFPLDPSPTWPPYPGGSFSPAPDEGRAQHLWVHRNLPALQGREGPAPSHRSQLLDQFHLQNVDRSSGGEGGVILDFLPPLTPHISSARKSCSSAFTTCPESGLLITHC